MLSRVLDLGPLPIAALTPPLVVWAWGCALERLAVGLERLAEARRNIGSQR